ncbi:hypothetical protein VTI28DRAFT_7272 [Corynascus sepedonium]
MNQVWSRRPNTRADFKVAIICALPLEADAVIALYDHHWDDGDYSYGDKKTLCTECGCNGKLVPRTRLAEGKPSPAVHFGWIASGDALMRSGEGRDAAAQEEGIIAFEMEIAGVWDIFHRVVLIKGACDYADTHKTRCGSAMRRQRQRHA